MKRLKSTRIYEYRDWYTKESPRTSTSYTNVCATVYQQQAEWMIHPINIICATGTPTYPGYLVRCVHLQTLTRRTYDARTHHHIYGHCHMCRRARYVPLFILLLIVVTPATTTARVHLVIEGSRQSFTAANQKPKQQQE